LQLPKGRTFYTLACVFLVGLWGWSAQATVSRVYDQWSAKYLSKYVLARQGALKDQALGRRIYFGNSFFNWVDYPLNEGNKIYLWSPPNIIDLAANEKPQDVALYLEPKEADDKGQSIKDMLVKSFPDAQWTDIHSPAQAPTDDPILVRCFIPSADIASGSPGIFEVRQVPMPYWDRQYSDVGNGLAFDMVDYEDKVSDVNASAPPQFAQITKGVRYEGVIHVDGGGSYELNWKTAERTEVWVDGRSVLNLYFPRTMQFMSPERSGTNSVHLDAGDHKVVVISCFQRSVSAPEISISHSGTEGQGKSLWYSSNF
jgi:hypothetical protein